MASEPTLNVSIKKSEITDTDAPLPGHLDNPSLLHLFKMTLEFAADEVFWMQSDSRIMHANQAACRKLEYRLDELIGKYVWEWDPLFPKEVWPTIWRELNELKHIEFEAKHQTKFGRIFPVYIRAHLLNMGEQQYLIAYASDISEQKEKEGALRDYERDLEALHSHKSGDSSPEGELGYLKSIAKRLSKLEVTANIGTWEIDLVENSLSLSEQTRRIHDLPQGFTPEVNNAYMYYKAGRDREIISTAYKQAIASLTPWDEELTLVTPAGDERLVRVIGNAEADDQGRCLRVFGVMQDVTYRDKLRKKLAESENTLQKIMDHSPAVVFVKDLRGRYQFVNKQYLSIFNFTREQVLGKTDFELLPEDVARAVTANDKRVIASQTNQASEEEIPQRNGLRVYISEKFPLYDQDGKVNALCGISTDITEQRSSEEQLRHAQKMDALGKLTGGIAHDFNNLLGIIMGHSELIQFRAGSGESSLSSSAQQITKACERGKKLTKRLLGFSSKRSPNMLVVSVNDILNQNYEMFQKILTVNIAITLDLSPSLLPCEIEVGEFEDALLNLILNAQYAMRGKGELTIATRNTNAAVYTELEPGCDYVHISVTDCGSGMDNVTKARIFEPFYTTKGSDGTGLGLSQVYGFVKRCNGQIRVISEPGEGTTVELYFPAKNEQPMEYAQESVLPEPSPDGFGCILVVDDETELVNLIEVMLTTSGYTVIGSSSPQDALKILAEQPVDLVISDIVMPKMDGLQFMALVKEKHPNMPSLFISGYPGRQQAVRKIQESKNPILFKPFKAEELMQRVGALLGADAKTSREN